LSPRNKKTWTPSGDPVSARNWQPWALVGASVLVVMFAAGLFVDETQPKPLIRSLNAEDGNLVRVTNDSTSPVYFVPCADAACDDLPYGNSPGDYNLVTPSHQQNIRLPRDRVRTLTFGVYGDDRDLSGCVYLRTEKSRQRARDITLSAVQESCAGDRPVAKNTPPSTTSSSTTSTTVALTSRSTTTTTTIDDRDGQPRNQLDEA
jgi:hypothetical protein